MLASVLGACARAPRLSGLKKPRPLKSLSPLEGAVSSQAAGGDDVSIKTKSSFGTLDVNVFADYDHSQKLPTCKESTALSSSWLPSTIDHNETLRSSCPQDSDSSFNSTDSSHKVELQESSLAVPSQSIDCNQYHFTSTNSPEFNEKCHSSQGPNFPALNTNGILEDSFDVMVLGNCICPRKTDFMDENYRISRPHKVEPERDGHPCWTPQSTTTQLAKTVLDHNQSCEDQSWRSTIITSSGDELSVTGKNFQTVVLATKILLKELDASLVEMETEPSAREQGMKQKVRRQLYFNTVKELDEPSQDDEYHSTILLSQETRWKPSWHYSKHELLQLSMSELSHRPPSLWNLIAGTHADCCFPASQVKEYFDPSDFYFHDGTFVVPGSFGRVH